jgi:UDP:flavonoid glycosyltransferase YjiC (YdhE family)
MGGIVDTIRKRILFAPATYNLAETTRMLDIARGVSRHEFAKDIFEVYFLSEGGQFERLIEKEGYTLERSGPPLTDEKIAHIYAVNDEEKIGTIFTTQELVTKVTGDVAYLKELQPTVVITGSNLSVPVACQITDTPLVWTVQSTWFEEFFVSGAGVTDGIRFAPLKRIADFFIFIGIKFWMWYGFIRPINAAAKHFGVKEYKPVFNFFKGDITLVAEPSGFSGIPLPENHFYVGPLLANQDFPIPDEVRNIPRDMPLVYFAMGSSGTATVVAQIIESFKGAPYRVIAPVRQLIKTKPDLEIPPNVLVTDWLPALQVSQMADLSVIHGGIGTVMTAALAGKPVVGVGMQPEQRANIACLERKGFAVRLSKSKDLPKRIQEAIRNQLSNSEAKRKAEEYSMEMAKWDGPYNAADILYQKFGKAY